MTQAIEAAITEIATVVAAQSGIKQAPTYPTEEMNEYPFAIIYYRDGNTEAAPLGSRKQLFNVCVDLLTRRMNIAVDLATLTPYLDTLTAALLLEVSDGGDRFSNTISTFRNVAVSLIPAVDYAGVQMIGYRFVLEDVKILVNQ